MASRVDRGIALPFLDRGIRRGWVVSSTPQPHFTPGKDAVPIVQEAGWAPGPVWTAENLAPPGFDPRTIQPVVSRCTDWATWLTNLPIYFVKNMSLSVMRWLVLPEIKMKATNSSEILTNCFFLKDVARYSEKKNYSAKIVLSNNTITHQYCQYL
jgi:hypothetical protein